MKIEKMLSYYYKDNHVLYAVKIKTDRLSTQIDVVPLRGAHLSGRMKIAGQEVIENEVSYIRFTLPGCCDDEFSLDNGHVKLAEVFRELADELDPEDLSEIGQLVEKIKKLKQAIDQGYVFSDWVNNFILDIAGLPTKSISEKQKIKIEQIYDEWELENG